MAILNEQIRAFLNPSSIAFIGASEDVNSVPGRAVKHAMSIGYKGRMIPVNPKRNMIMGLRSYPAIEDVPGAVDLAVLLRPYSEMPALLEACGRKGVRFAVAIGSGFAETGEDGVLRQESLLQAARSSGVRVLGPNCMGYINLHGKVCTSFGSIMELPMVPGNVAIVSQSGAMGGSIMNRLQDAGGGISYLISTGNEMDLGMVDFVDFLVQDPTTEAILTYLEGIRDGRRLLDAAERAFAAGKPLIIMQIGTSAIGRRVTATHTANLAISKDVLRGALRQKGAIICDDMEELVGATAILTLGPLPAGDGIGCISTSGGAAGLFADKAEEVGLKLPPFSASTNRELASLLQFGTAQNPLDLTGQAAGDRSLFLEALDLLLKEDAIHLLLIILTQIHGERGQILFKRVAEKVEESVKPMGR
jgi:acetyltransferase